MDRIQYLSAVPDARVSAFQRSVNRVFGSERSIPVTGILDAVTCDASHAVFEKLGKDAVTALRPDATEKGIGDRDEVVLGVTQACAVRALQEQKVRRQLGYLALGLIVIGGFLVWKRK